MKWTWFIQEYVAREESIDKITIKEFRETGNRIIVMQNRIRQLLDDEKQQKEDLMFQVSAVSHDLKTPLTIIKGNAEFCTLPLKMSSLRMFSRYRSC